MKWKGGRMSGNIVDKRGEVPNYDPEIEEALAELERKKNNPTGKQDRVGRGKAARKGDRLKKIDHIQVTPGKWKSN